MSLLSFLVPDAKRLVILVGDEAISVVPLGRKREIQPVRVFTYDAASHSLAGFTDYLLALKGARIDILMDTVDQYYKRDYLPKASIFDVPKIRKRRLDLHFPSHEFKGAIALAPDLDRAMERPYLMTAFTPSPLFIAMMNVLQKSDVGIASLSLLPLESASLGRALQPHFGFTTVSNRWQLFLTVEAHGTLRQIITRDDELVLTRSTPWTGDFSENNIEVLHEEVRATLSYLSRFGYDARSGIQIALLGNRAVAHGLEQLLPNAEVRALSSTEAARFLNFRVYADLPADGLHGAWFAFKLKPVLSLMMPRYGIERRQRQLVRGYTYFLAGLCLLWCGLLIGSVSEAVSAGQRQKDLEQYLATLRQQSAAQEIELALLPAGKESFNLSTNFYRLLQKKNVDPAHIVNTVAQGFPPEGRLMELVWQRDEHQGEASPDAMPETMSLSLQLDMTALGDGDAASRAVQDYVRLLQQRLPSHEIAIEANVLDALPTQVFTGTASPDVQDEAAFGLFARLTIKGPPL